jgi:TolB protein
MNGVAVRVVPLILTATLACSGRGDANGPEPQNSSPGSLPTAVSPFPTGLKGTLAFESDREGRTKIYTLQLETGKITRLTEGPLWHDSHPTWSPDGRRIAFHSTRNGNFDIYVMDADGGNIQRLTDHPANEFDPTWDKDMRSIVFTGERDGRGEIYRVWLDSKKVDRLTAGFDRAIMPAESPDGRYVAYAGQTIREFQIHVVDLTRNNEISQVTSGEAACRPAFSPDSRAIAFVLGQDPSRLGIVDMQTRQARTLYKHPSLWLYYPVFSPDGERVAFAVSPQHHQGEDWDLAIVSTQSPATTFQRLTVGPGNDRLPSWKPIPH